MPPVNKSMDARVNFVVQTRQQAVQKIAHISRSLGEASEASSKRSKQWYDEIDDLLSWLESDAQVTVELAEHTKLKETLSFMFDRPEFHFPVHFVERARALYQRFENEDWGRQVDTDMHDDTDADSAIGLTAPPKSPTRRARRESAGKKQVVVRPPPANHSVWGLKGIMHGLAMSVSYNADGSKRQTPVFDERFHHEKRDAKVHGHNGIEIGQWFPKQLAALFGGAHGHSQAGVSGDRNNGAYSIVISGNYDDLDTDNGEYLYYSAPNSHDNEDPKTVPQAGGQTLALHKSLQTGKPVRVLRSSSGKSRYAPYCGLRYDGLYRIVTLSNPKNNHGGMYEQFGLERLGGQGDINLRRPNSQERRDFDRIRDGYPGAR